MNKLTSLKEYNRVTERVRTKFKQVRDQANKDFFEGLLFHNFSANDFPYVEELLHRRDVAISDAYKGQREEAALAWQLYRSENPRPGA